MIVSFTQRTDSLGWIATGWCELFIAIGPDIIVSFIFRATFAWQLSNAFRLVSNALSCGVFLFLRTTRSFRMSRCEWNCAAHRSRVHWRFYKSQRSRKLEFWNRNENFLKLSSINLSIVTTWWLMRRSNHANVASNRLSSTSLLINESRHELEIDFSNSVLCRNDLRHCGACSAVSQRFETLINR